MKKQTHAISLLASGKFRATFLLCGCMLIVKPTFAYPNSIAERSVIVSAPVDKVWSRFGGFCAVADWDPAFSSCHFQHGRGGVGTIRRIGRHSGGGTIVEELTATSGTSYSYRAIDGSSEGTLAMRAGPRPGTTLVTWRIAAGPTATDAFREALDSRLGPAVQNALDTLARLAGNGPNSDDN